MNVIRSQGGTHTVHPNAAGTLRPSSSGASNFDKAKVDRIRTAIAAGSYTVDPELIASRVMADAQVCAAVGLPLPSAAKGR